MSELKLFEIGSPVKELIPSAVLLEKELQNTIEQNMEVFFGVRFLKSEYVITAGRMDSIGIDENNSPVIFEYKRAAVKMLLTRGSSILTGCSTIKLISNCLSLISWGQLLRSKSIGLYPA